MEFTLTISLDNAEAADAGPGVALPVYLRQVADRCEAGHTGTGTVRDGNGNAIGQYRTED